MTQCSGGKKLYKLHILLWTGTYSVMAVLYNRDYNSNRIRKKFAIRELGGMGYGRIEISFFGA